MENDIIFENFNQGKVHVDAWSSGCEIPTEKGEKNAEIVFLVKKHSTALVKLAMDGCDWAYEKIPNQLKVVKKNIKKNK